MGDKSKISWTDASWNPVTGCSKVSEGCRNCYAAQLAPRLAAMGQTHAYTDLPWTARNARENVRLHEDRLEMPLRWRRPRRVFVNSMSDLFHELVPFEFVDRVFAVMALAPQHTFQVLTKRPERMAEYLNRPWRSRAVEVGYAITDEFGGELPDPPWWPLPNVQLGTSVEAPPVLHRVGELLRCPAAVRFLSCEPLIAPLDLSPWLGYGVVHGDAPRHGKTARAVQEITRAALASMDGPKIHWVIAGGESGPGHRPLDHAWMRKIRDDCAAAGVAFWAKQDSGPRSEVELPEDLRIRQFPEAVAS